MQDSRDKSARKSRYFRNPALHCLIILIKSFSASRKCSRVFNYAFQGTIVGTAFAATPNATEPRLKSIPPKAVFGKLFTR